MKKWSWIEIMREKKRFTKHTRMKVVQSAVLAALLLCTSAGCGKMEQESIAEQDGEVTSAMRENTGIANETAADENVDFEILKEENPDIFAWLYIPDTKIDCPVLQNTEEDEFYKEHDAYGRKNDYGAAYIEIANLSSMCDFNTVIHLGKETKKIEEFADLYRFADPQFFKEHERFYLYMDGNVLTYEIFAAYERENISLIRSYDFTYLAGCQRFLNDMYGTRDLSMNLREGWDSVSPYHFLVTLTAQESDNADSQFVVIGIMVDDAAGKIDRVIME